VTAGAHRPDGERVGRLLWVVRKEPFHYLIRGQGIRNTVGADQVTVPHGHVERFENGLDRIAIKRAKHDRTLWMAQSLLGGQSSNVDEGLDEGLVLRDLCQDAVAKTVCTRISDVDEPTRVASESDRRESCPHPGVGWVRSDVFRDGGVAPFCRPPQVAQNVSAFPSVQGRKLSYQQGGGDLTGAMPTDAIRQSQKCRAGMDRVLVGLPVVPPQAVAP
jgi:hypothetical protein